MTQTLDPLVTGTPARGRTAGSFGTFKELERPGDVFRDLGPNWFALVMGTGIVANAAAVLPLRAPGLRVFATVVWALAARGHADVLRGASVVLFGLLVLAWVVVAARTVSGAASGRLFAPLPASSRALST